MGHETRRSVCRFVIFRWYFEWIWGIWWIWTNSWSFWINSNRWFWHINCAFLDPSSNFEEDFAALDKIVLVSLYSFGLNCFWKGYHPRKVFSTQTMRKRYFFWFSWKFQRSDETKQHEQTNTVNGQHSQHQNWWGLA